jgi:hypothetical protein
MTMLCCFAARHQGFRKMEQARPAVAAKHLVAHGSNNGWVQGHATIGRAGEFKGVEVENNQAKPGLTRLLTTYTTQRGYQ